MHKGDFVKFILEHNNCTQNMAEQAINMFTSSVIDALIQGNKISLIGFGKFSVSKIEARNGRNLKTGDSVRHVARQEILNLNLNAFMKT